MMNPLLFEHRPGHSRFQMENFILRKEGVTDFGIWRQALRELAAREEVLASLEDEIAGVECELERSRFLRWVLPFPWSRKRCRARVRFLESKLHTLQRKLDDVKRERDFFERSARAKRPVGELTDGRLEELEENHWVTVFRNRIAIQALCREEHPRIPPNLMEAILSLPRDRAEPLIEEGRPRNPYNLALAGEVNA